MTVRWRWRSHTDIGPKRPEFPPDESDVVDIADKPVRGDMAPSIEAKS